MKTGTFPEGTLIVKELTRVLNPTFPDGSRKEPSGRGFFNGEFNGIDAAVKDSKRFAATNGWGYFTFGHHLHCLTRRPPRNRLSPNVRAVILPMSRKPI